MNASSKRLFVGNIPAGTTESELLNEFGAYGKVLSVEVKVKNDNKSENGQSVFAFVNLETDGWGLQKCINEFSNEKWKGQYLKVAPAKESFMEQLKREREEAKQKDGHKNTYIHKSDEVTSKSENISTKLNALQKNIAKKDSSDSSTSESSDSDDEKTKQTASKPLEKETVLQKLENFSEFWKDKDEEVTVAPDYVIKNNKHKYVDKGKALKIESLNKTSETPKPKTVKKVTDPQVILAEKKRLQSLNEKKAQYNQQKNLLQKALSNIDSKSSNKIIFNEDGNINNENMNQKKKNKTEIKANKHNQQTNSKKPKLALFDDGVEEDDNEQFNFEIKQQFQGDKGQKLLELQSRFANDERFAIDSRFLENEADKDLEENDQEGFDDQQQERERQFKILGEVMGKSYDDKRPVNKDDISRTGKAMLRFDPSKPEHERFLIEKKNDLGGKDSKKRKRPIVEIDNSAPIEQPIVSKEKFYKVTNELKESLQEKSDFSLLKLFGRENENDTKDQEQADYEMKDMSKKSVRNIMNVQDNPFRYDSSDSEDENENDAKPSSKYSEAEPTNAGMLSKGVWRENFFFKTNDQRILDGVAFFTTRIQENDNVSFTEKRRELKLIVRNKVRHNIRNKPQFTKKLGGKKRFIHRKK